MDGVDDFVSFEQALVPAAGDVTVSVAFQARGTRGPLHELLSQKGGNQTNFYLGRGPTGYIRAGDDWENTGVPFPSDGQWHFLTLVRGASDTWLYLDGKEVARKGAPVSLPAGQEFRIGRQFDPHGEYFAGRIAQVQVWKLARRPEDIARDMRGGLRGDEHGLACYLPLNSATGDKVVDQVTGAHGRLLGATWSGQSSQEAIAYNKAEEAFLAAQQALFQLEAVRQAQALEVEGHRTGLTYGSTVELVSALTCEPLWVSTDVVARFNRRAMLEPPPDNCETTRWMCLSPKGSGAGPVRYGDMVTLWNPGLSVNANLNARAIDRGVEATLELAGANFNEWRSFRLVPPTGVSSNAIIRSGDPVALECCFNLGDPVRFLRPVKKNGRWWVERWEKTLPELHTFHVRILDKPSTASGEGHQRPRLTSSSVVRLLASGSRPVWVSAQDVATFKRRVVADPFQGEGLADRWRLLKEGASADTPLSYGDIIALRNLAPGVYANLNARQADRGIEATGQHIDEWRRFRLVHPSNPGSTAPIHQDEELVLECQFNPTDPTRVLTLHQQDGHHWLHREERRGAWDRQLFRFQLAARSDSLALQQARLDELGARVEQQRQEVGRQVAQLAEPRKRLSLELSAASRGAIVRPPSSGGQQPPQRFARLNSPMTLTLEARVYLREPLGEWACVVGKGRSWDAQDYLLRVRRDGLVQLMAHEAGRATALSLDTPAGVVQRERWHHLAGVVDLARMQARILVDGQEVASRTVSRTMTVASGVIPGRWRGLLCSPDAPLVFGRSPVDDDPSSGLNGYLDEVRLWSVVRTEQALRDGLHRRASGQEEGLVGCWSFGDVSFGRVKDRTLNGNDAFLLTENRDE